MNRRRLFQWLALLGAAVPAPAPATPPTVLQRSPVRGFRHRQPRELLDRLAIGDTLMLRAEPGNPHDRRAVMIFWHDQHIGYLPREDNAHASRLLRQGVKVEGRLVEVRPEGYEWEPLRLEVTLSRQA